MSDPRLNGLAIGGASAPVAPPAPPRKGAQVEPGRFGELLTQEIERGTGDVTWSAHATERLRQRGIALTPQLEAQVSAGMDMAAGKGAKSSLVLTETGAFVVSVPNRTVITAMDPAQMRERVVTNIDSAVIAPPSA